MYSTTLGRIVSPRMMTLPLLLLLTADEYMALTHKLAQLSHKCRYTNQSKRRQTYTTLITGLYCPPCSARLERTGENALLRTTAAKFTAVSLALCIGVMGPPLSTSSSPAHPPLLVSLTVMYNPYWLSADIIPRTKHLRTISLRHATFRSSTMQMPRPLWETFYWMIPSCYTGEER